MANSCSSTGSLITSAISRWEVGGLPKVRTNELSINIQALEEPRLPLVRLKNAAPALLSRDAYLACNIEQAATNTKSASCTLPHSEPS